MLTLSSRFWALRYLPKAALKLVVCVSILATSGCTSPRSGQVEGKLPDLAPSFGESTHGFVPLSPSLRGSRDTLRNATHDREGRLVLRDGGLLESQLHPWARPFDELLLSWNATVPDGAGLVVEVQLASLDRDEQTPWLHLGGWGETPPREERVTEFDGGRVAVDVVTCEKTFDAFRYRLSAIGKSNAPVIVHQTYACITLRSDLATLEPAPPAVGIELTLDVPARSQKLAKESIAPRICSPTSVAMVLAHNGVDLSLEDLAAEIYDADHDIYGNWPRAVQAAFTHGVPGALVRLSSWGAVESFLRAGVPLVVSVKAEPGELRGAPYPRTSGHLIVLCGFDGRGRIVVNDPAAGELVGVRRIYEASDLENCWMRRGGVAYALGPRQ